MKYPMEVKWIPGAMVGKLVVGSREVQGPHADDCRECYVLRGEFLLGQVRRFE